MRFTTPLAVAVMLALGACSSFAGGDDASPADAPHIASGRLLAERHCAACHAIDRSDASTHAEAPPLRQLSRNYPPSAMEEALAEGIMVGHPDMPEFRFRPDDVAALIAYLDTIQEKR